MTALNVTIEHEYQEIKPDYLDSDSPFPDTLTFACAMAKHYDNELQICDRIHNNIYVLFSGIKNNPFLEGKKAWQLQEKDIVMQFISKLEYKYFNPWFYHYYLKDNPKKLMGKRKESFTKILSGINDTSTVMNITKVCKDINEMYALGIIKVLSEIGLARTDLFLFNFDNVKIYKKSAYKEIMDHFKKIMRGHQECLDISKLTQRYLEKHGSWFNNL